MPDLAASRTFFAASPGDRREEEERGGEEGQCRAGSRAETVRRVFKRNEVRSKVEFCCVAGSGRLIGGWQVW